MQDNKTEKQAQKQLEKARLDALEKKSFAESVKEVKKVTSNYLSDPPDNGKKALASLLYVVGAGNLQIRNNEKTDNWTPAADNGLPAAFYVSGGGRIIFKFHSDLSEENKTDFKNMFQNYEEQQRDTSTHRLVKKGEEVKEIKTNGIIDFLRTKGDEVNGRTKGDEVKEIKTNGIIDFLRTKGDEVKDFLLRKTINTLNFILDTIDAMKRNNTKLSRVNNHYGLDLKIPGKNHGHMYIGKFDDGMMVGVENVTPGEPGHQWYNFGKSDKVSAWGVEKFRVQEVKQKIAGEEAYANTVVPGKYNCMKVTVTNELIQGLQEFQQGLEAGTIDQDIGSKIPAKSMEEFNSAKLHNTPEMKPPKIIEAPDKPKALGLKKAANRIVKGLQYILALTVVVPLISKLISGKWIVKPFQKELNEYKKKNSEYKIQNKVVEAGKQRDALKAEGQNQGVEGTEIKPQVGAEAKSAVNSAASAKITQNDLNKSQIQQTSSTKGQGVS